MNHKDGFEKTPRDQHFLDITADLCPLTFVRTRLLVEKMQSGETATIRLQGAEPLDKVPRGLRAQGLSILEFLPEPAVIDPHGVHRLRIRKR